MSSAITRSNAGVSDRLYRGWARALSLLTALAISLSILIWPNWVMSDSGTLDHRWLSLLLWGMAAGFVHGVGFVPRNRLLRLMLGPQAAWGLSLLAAWAIATA